MKEKAIRFGQSTGLTGILTKPLDNKHREPLPPVILLNDGLIHRVGPNQVSVMLARRLAEVGAVAFRFDFSGIGDSEVRQDDLPFAKSSVRETQEAMTVLSKLSGKNQFVLMGMCSGGLRAFRIALVDPRVVGVVMINPQPYHQERSDPIKSYIRHRKRQRFSLGAMLCDPDRWARALTGKLNYVLGVKTLFSKLTRMFDPQKIVSPIANQLVVDFRELTNRGCRVLGVFSEGNPGLEFLKVTISKELQEFTRHGQMNLKIVSGADHNFTLLCNQEALVQGITTWMNEKWVDEKPQIFPAGPVSQTANGQTVVQPVQRTFHR